MQPSFPFSPSGELDLAAAALRRADRAEWESDLAAAFRLRLAQAERLLLALIPRVEQAESACARAGFGP